jgi:hypothetical protein
VDCIRADVKAGGVNACRITPRMETK